MTSPGEKGLALGPQNILSSELHPLNFLQTVDKDLWNLVLKCICHTNESKNKILRWMFINLQLKMLRTNMRVMLLSRYAYLRK